MTLTKLETLTTDGPADSYKARDSKIAREKTFTHKELETLTKLVILTMLEK